MRHNARTAAVTVEAKNRKGDSGLLGVLAWCSRRTRRVDVLCGGADAWWW
jgi:hypothetical protein